MLNSLVHLLGEDAPAWRRYLAMVVAYGLLSGLTLCALVPVLSHVLAGELAVATLWLAALLVGVAVCWVWRIRVENAGVALGVAVLRGGRQQLGDHVARLPLGWFNADNSARLNHLLTQGMMSIAQLPAHVFTPLICGAVTPLVMVLALCTLHGSLGLLALLGLPLFVAVLGLSARLGRRSDEAFHRQFARTSQRVVEFAQAQPVLRAFNAEGGGTRLLEQALEQQRQAGRRLVWQSSLSVVLNGWLVQALFAVVLVAAAQALDAGLSNAERVGLVLALVLSSRYLDPLLEVASYVEIMRGAKGQSDALAEILAASPLPEPQQPQAPADASIELRGVSFAYAAGQPDVLHDLTLRIAPGSMTALVGASGSGKTTLVRLLARFFDVSAGSVQLGGVDVRQMTDAQLAGQISQIFQDSYLFQGSIADNIRIGNAQASDAQILAVAQQAGVTEIIQRLPQGLDTPVGEGGAWLSGGERQRIAIARALLKDAPILLVDEATAALDAENQALIAALLARLRGQRTLVVIAHQLSTVAQADQVLVLEDGRLVEQGRPAELRARQGRYAQFLQQRQAAKGWRITSGSEQS